MAQGASMGPLLSLAGWAFLPRMVTGWLMTIWFGITIRAGEPRPQPGSPKHEHLRRRVQLFVVSAYLLYTIFEADHDIRRASSYYVDLGVTPDAPERDIKSRFRRLAALHHPDKTGTGGGGDGAAFFMQLKVASETLLQDSRRFAYDRFGPDVTKWEKCVTIHDFVTRGLMYDILPYYAIAVATILVLSFLRFMDHARFYRWLILLAMGLMELHLATRPVPPTFLNAINAVLTTLTRHPGYLAFQLVTLGRKVALTIYVAMSQLGPLIDQISSENQQQQRSHSSGGGGDTEQDVLEGLARLEMLAQQMDADASRLVEMEIAPFKSDVGAASNLQGKMREWLVQNTVRADPMVRDAVGTSLRRRRTNAPAGARGTK